MKQHVFCSYSNALWYILLWPLHLVIFLYLAEWLLYRNIFFTIIQLFLSACIYLIVFPKAHPLYMRFFLMFYKRKALWLNVFVEKHKCIQTYVKFEKFYRGKKILIISIMHFITLNVSIDKHSIRLYSLQSSNRHWDLSVSWPGKLEGWGARELEGWKAGELEGWRAGGLESWRAGGLQN